ncbi:MAG TPA: AgmX/PglI C-terminal domain-containing protein [Myxococcaceae bacterium]|nr:AgmX/PglI C-terminal domain-containing protein [Myxococcaceae bacterium]
MSGQPAVLQVVILRDGLLVGTEVFVPGSYVLGSADDSDLRLDDAAVDPHHAVLYFQNGKAAVQDSGSVGGLYVNGHQVTACEIRSVDEVVLGPFVLKTRVLGPRATPKATPPPEVSALLGSVPPAGIPQVQPISAPRRSAPPPPPAEPEATAPAPYATRAPVANGPSEGTGTMPSARRRKGKAQRHDDEPLGPLPSPLPSEALPPLDVYERPAAPARPTPERPWSEPAPAWPPPASARAPVPSRPPRSPPAPPPAPVAPAPVHRPATAPPRRAPAGATARGPQLFAVPTKGGRGRPRLFFQLYWQDARQLARSFGPTSQKKPITSGLADVAMVPFYGFTMPEGFPLAESAGRGAYRLYLPPKAELEKRRSDGRFVPAGESEVETYDGRKCVLLQSGNAVALREGEMTCFVYVAPPPERTFVNPLRGKPWFFIFLFLAFFSPTVWWIFFGPQGAELADFNARNLNPVAVRLMAPKKEEKKKEEKKPEKKEEKKEEAKKEEKKPEKKKEPEKKVVKAPPPKAPPQPVPPTPQPPANVQKALAKVTAAGPAMKSMLAAINKLGPGGNAAAFKLNGLVGKGPVASNVGMPGLGVGNGTGGGRELLMGKGGGGIGAMGAGGVGKGPVRAGVARAASDRVSSQGQIDKEAVAKAINSHLAEIQRCYESALLKNPGLAGKVVLEWSISTQGRVVSSKSKSSTLKDSSVESCILRSLNTWQFPPARGQSVIISYPFIFNAVGF